MKNQIRSFFCFALLLLLFLPIAKAVGSTDIPSAWASSEISDALAQNLIPQQLNSAYQNNITREEFCVLSAHFLEVKTGQSAEELLRKCNISYDTIFSDTNNPSVTAMSAFGVVSGIGNGQFAPSNGITREQAATMLWNICQLYNGIQPNLPTNIFSDQSEISSWAKDSVAAITACTTGDREIMGSTSHNQFSPHKMYSREQAFLTILRLADYIGASEFTGSQISSSVRESEDLSENEHMLHSLIGSAWECSWQTLEYAFFFEDGKGILLNGVPIASNGEEFTYTISNGKVFLHWPDFDGVSDYWTRIWDAKSGLFSRTFTEGPGNLIEQEIYPKEIDTTLNEVQDIFEVSGFTGKYQYTKDQLMTRYK